ncbi:phosphoglucosamine mutase [bacterium F11]|nr:phosphoglucosamine mutase [bacterium F11]
MKRLFGTDGIRGLSGQYPLTPKEVYRIGLSAGMVLRDHYKDGPIRVLLVRDTRESGSSLGRMLTDGLRDTGVDVFDVGVLCTPSVAYLVQAHQFQSGVVISASHNPPEFNGIKFFTRQGRKWPDVWEEAIESHLTKTLKKPKGVEKGRLIPSPQLVEDYESFLIKTLPHKLDLSKLRIGLDCSNGANYSVAPQILRFLGASVFVMGDKPTGKNINVRCGSQQTDRLGQLVRKKRCHVGVAFDGDGDRVIFTDEKGQVIDGDFIIGLLAKHLKSEKRLKNNKVVITVMSNLGLRMALVRLGVRIVETPVGDRYVSEAMRKNRAVLGGEQSGHIILGSYLPSGDGLLTALHVLAIVARARTPFSHIVGWMRKFPQTLVNVLVKERKPIPEMNGVQSKIDDIRNSLGQKGRILVRYSGTEPLLRIMIEGPTKKIIDQYASELVTEIESTIN